MAVTVDELQDGRAEQWAESANDQSTIEVPYLVRGASSPEDARDAVRTAAPLTDRGLVRKSVDLLEEVTDTIWKYRVRYATPNYGQVGQIPDPEISYDVNAGTLHVTQSLARRGYARLGLTAPDLQGAIGYDGEHVAGVDIKVFACSWQETHYFTDSGWDADRLMDMFPLGRCSVNLETFRGRPPGTVLFEGFSARRRGRNADDLWEVTFRFSFSPNVLEMQIGDITGIVKNGWEYVDVLYADAVDSTAKYRLKRPEYVFVHQLYEQRPFVLLGI